MKTFMTVMTIAAGLAGTLTLVGAAKALMKK